MSDPLATSAPHFWGGDVTEGRGLVDDLWAERERQLTKWGAQHHPDGTFNTPEFRWQADFDRAQSDEANEHGTITWRQILQEEVSEAFAEADPAKLRAELVQVAAVAAAWIEDIDSREAK